MMKLVKTFSFHGWAFVYGKNKYMGWENRVIIELAVSNYISCHTELLPRAISSGIIG